jgi:hypothetical protein
MKYFALALALTANCFLAGCAVLPHAAASSRESVEWCDVWISHANETNLPRVLLIGDSITRAYDPEVEKHLAGKAYVGRLASSAFISDPALLKQIAMVLSQYKFAVIHFNNGMHGWNHSETEYAEALPQLLAAIKAGAPNAKLIWANTTTLKNSRTLPAGDQRQAADERIAARNEIAAQFMLKAGIPVDDLNSLGRGHPEYHSDNIHFNDQGIALQAAQVAAQIEPFIKK